MLFVYGVLTLFFQMFKGINQTCPHNKKFSLDKTGQANVSIDLAISAQKFHKIVTQEEKTLRESQKAAQKTFHRLSRC